MKALLLMALVLGTGCGDKRSVEAAPPVDVKCTCSDCTCDVGKPCQCVGCKCEHCKGKENAPLTPPGEGGGDHGGDGCSGGHC